MDCPGHPDPSRPRSILACAETGGEEVLLVGFSTRALADSALLAGYHPRTVDFYGDADQKAKVENVALGRDLGLGWSADEAARVAVSMPVARVAFAADLENAPNAVERLARGRELLGNAGPALRAVRDPRRLFAALSAAGVATPTTVCPGGERIGGFPSGLDDAKARAAEAWLRKPVAAGGGRGVVRVRAGRPPSPSTGEVLQELVDGPVLGLAFLADGSDVRPLALSLQIEDREAFGARGFAYVGSVAGAPLCTAESELREQALRAAAVVTREFGLRGLNGMDFVAWNGEVVPLEINPRHTASMELWDDAGTRLFGAHVAACRGGLSGGWLARPARARGKAILYARRAVVAGNVARAGRDRAALVAGNVSRTGRDAARTTAERAERGAWSGAAVWPSAAVADVPHPGDRIARGQPVCTLLAAGDTMDACVAALRTLARAAEEELEDA